MVCLQSHCLLLRRTAPAQEGGPQTLHGREHGEGVHKSRGRGASLHAHTILYKYMYTLLPIVASVPMEQTA